MSQRGQSEYNQFVHLYYPMVAHLDSRDRFAALAALRERMVAEGKWQKQYSPSYGKGRHASPRHCNRLPAKKCKTDQHCSWIKRSPSHKAYCRRQGGFLVPPYRRRSRFVGTRQIPAVYLAAASKVLAPQIAAAAGIPEAPPITSPLATLLAPAIPEAPPLTTDKDIVAAAVDDVNAGFCTRFTEEDCQKHFRCSWDAAARICRLAAKAKELAPSERMAAFDKVTAESEAKIYADEAKYRAQRTGFFASPKGQARQAARRAARQERDVGIGGLFEPGAPAQQRLNLQWAQPAAAQPKLNLQWVKKAQKAGWTPEQIERARQASPKTAQRQNRPLNLQWAQPEVAPGVGDLFEEPQPEIPPPGPLNFQRRRRPRPGQLELQWA